MSQTTDGPADTGDEQDHGFGKIPDCNDDPKFRAIFEQLAASAVEDCRRVAMAGAADRTEAETQRTPHWAAELDERALLSVTDEVLDGLRRSSEGQPGQDEMLNILTAMRVELGGD